MNGAINSTTKKYVQAWIIGVDPSYQFPKDEKWYADPNDILSYDKDKVKDITKIEVRYRKGADGVINWNGTEYSIAPCFFIPNKTELGINTVPESKEHKLAKEWVYNRIKNKKLIFQYSTVHRPWDYNNEINIKDLNVDYEKIGIEITVRNNKAQRADILIPLKEYDEFFGTGIDIEIQFSKQQDSTTEKRSYKWAFKGYSICWLWIDDFENISKELIELKEDKLIIEPVQKILHDFSKKNLDEVRQKTQLLSRMIDKKMRELNYPFVIGECKVCGKGYMVKKKGKYGWFYGCSNYPECRHIIKIPDGEDDTN